MFVRGLLFAALLLMILSACVPVEPVSQDPIMQQLEAQARITATAQARAVQAQEATATAAVALDRSQREIAQAEKRLSLQQTENALMDARTTATVQAFAMQAGYATATQQAIAGRATQSAIELQIIGQQKQAAREQAMAEFLTWFVPGSIFILAALLVVILGGFAWRLADWWIVWQDRRNSVQEKRSGIIVWRPNQDGLMEPTLLASMATTSYRRPAEPPHGVTSLGTRGIAWSSPARQPDDSPESLALRLVQDARRVAGNEAQILPGWRDLPGWTSGAWQSVVRELENAGLVNPRPHQVKCLVGRYQCLYDLEIYLQSHKGPLPQSVAGD